MEWQLAIYCNQKSKWQKLVLCRGLTEPHLREGERTEEERKAHDVRATCSISLSSAAHSWNISPVSTGSILLLTSHMHVPLGDLRGQEDENKLYSWVSVEQFVFIHWVLQVHEEKSCKHFIHFITRLKMLTEEAANGFVSVHSLLYSTVDPTPIQTSLNQRVGHFLCRWFWWLYPITSLGLVWWTVVLETQWGKWGDGFECKTRNWGGWG